MENSGGRVAQPAHRCGESRCTHDSEKMNNCIVREAMESDSQDLDRVSESAIATLRQTYRPTEEAIAHRQSIAPALTQLVAVVNDKVVGSVEYHIEEDRVHFRSLFVHHGYRQQGVAKRLIAKLYRIGERIGLRYLSAYTVCQTGNPEIFKRLGFVVISEEPATRFESERYDCLTEVLVERSIESGRSESI